MVAGAGEVEGGPAGALVAAQGGALLPTYLALDHAAPASRVRRPLHITLIGDIHLLSKAWVSKQYGRCARDYDSAGACWFFEMVFAAASGLSCSNCQMKFFAGG